MDLGSLDSAKRSLDVADGPTGRRMDKTRCGVTAIVSRRPSALSKRRAAAPVPARFTLRLERQEV